MTKRQQCHGHLQSEYGCGISLHHAQCTDVPAKYVRIVTSQEDIMAPSFVLGVIFRHYFPDPLFFSLMQNETLWQIFESSIAWLLLDDDGHGALAFPQRHKRSMFCTVGIRNKMRGDVRRESRNRTDFSALERGEDRICAAPAKLHK